MSEQPDLDSKTRSIQSYSDRQWSLPNCKPFMRMSWHDLLFAHWRVPAEVLRPTIPPKLEIDTFDGDAWIGVVPFRMTDVAPRGVPSIPWLSAFPELNVRTYVTIEGKPGVWFYSLDATNPVAVRAARLLFHLPYMDARIDVRKEANEVAYQSTRTHRNEPPAALTIEYAPAGEPFFAERGNLEFWLTARYCLYVADRRGRIMRGEIDHEPWKLQPAECSIHENSMIDRFDVVDSTRPVHLLFVDSITVKAWRNTLASSP